MNKNSIKWVKVKKNLEKLNCPNLGSIHKKHEGKILEITSIRPKKDLEDFKNEYFVKTPSGNEISYLEKEVILLTELEKKIEEKYD